MPSRNSTSASRQVSTVLSTQEAAKDFATPVVDEDGCDIEYVLDFQGNRHVNSSGANYNGYTLAYQEEQSTPYQTFDLAGLASANQLRDYLRNILQPSQITNEYGDECDLADISVDQLVVLQAKLWSTVSNDRAPGKPALRPSRAQVLVAGHVAKISELLEDKHIFILSRSELDTCQYLKGLQRNSKHACQSQIVRLEPLVHWGTVTSSITTRTIFAFNRNGELMQETGYFHLVRRLVDADAPAYCIDCLAYLWSKRTEARDTTKQFQSAVKQLDPCEFEVPPHSQTSLGPKGIREPSEGVKSHAVDGFVWSPLDQATVMEGVGEYNNVEMGMPQLDGASDGFDRAPSRHNPLNSPADDSIVISSESDEIPEQDPRPGLSVAGREPFTLPLRMTSTSPRVSDRSSPLPELDFSTTAQLSTTKRICLASEIGKPAGERVTNDKTISNIIDLITPPRAKQRQFGNELTTNPKLRRSPRNHKTSAPISKESSYPPVLPMKSLTALSKTAKSPTKEAKKRKATPLGRQQVKQEKPKASTAKVIAVLRPDAQIKFDVASQLPAAAEQYVAAHSPPEPQLIVNFAKRPTNIIVPDGIATLTYEESLNTSPLPTAKICWCNKPAGYTTSKPNDQPHVAQCMGPNCRFRWYHYACLNLSNKGQARFGKLVCQLCRNDQEFTELGKKNGWSVEQLLDFRLLWTKEEIATAMSGLGGCVVRADPYRLGLDVDLGPKHHTSSHGSGTLGSLDKFGLIKSHPYMLEEAYLSPDAYADLRAEMIEDGGRGRVVG